MNSPSRNPSFAADEQIAIVTVCGRTKLNVIDSSAIAETTRTLHDVAREPTLRVVVLRGPENTFIGGADINEMAGLTPDGARDFITKLHDLCLAIVAVPVPVIARGVGYCLGGGMEVAMACDLRLTTRSASWGMPEVRVGLPSVIQAALLPRLVGWGQTARLLYRGNIIDGTEAHRIGLADELTDDDSIDRAVAGAVDDILVCGPEAIRAQKRLLWAWADLPLEERYQISIDEFSRSFASSEPAEGLNAFLEKRPPRYAQRRSEG